MFYLTKIGKKYYFRLRVPFDVIPYFGQREIRRSLGTTRFKKAKSLLTQHSAQVERIFVMIRSGVLTNEQIKKIVNEYLDRGVSLFEAQRNNEKIFNDAEQQDHVSDHGNRLDQIIESDSGLEILTEARMAISEDAKKQMARRKGPAYPLITDFADFFLEQNSIQLDRDSVEYQKLCNELLKADLRLRAIISAHINGDYETEYDVALRDRKKSCTLSELIALYEKDKRDTWADPARFQSSHRQILHILGDIPLDQIDRAKSLKLRDDLKEYPRNLRQQHMEKPWKELAKIKAGRLSDKSQRFILSEYCTLISYAIENNLGIEGNPAKKLVGAKNDIKRHKIRTPYTQEELNSLIKLLAKVDKHKEPEVFWIPLLLLYTGARSNEICMLRCKDIELKGNVWIFHFRNNKDSHQRTKNNKDRHTPIHQRLIDLGFLDYWQKQQLSGSDRLFSNLSLCRNKWNVYFGKNYNRTFKKEFLLHYTDEQLKEKDLHTFRTTFIAWFIKDKKLMTVPNISLLQSIVGHLEKYEISLLLTFIESADIIIKDYGGGFGKEVEQNKLLQKLDYGIDLSPLIRL